MEKAANILAFIWLFSMMIQIGCSTNVFNILRSLRKKGVLIRGLALNYLIMPLISILLLWIYQAPASVAAGLLSVMVFSGASLGPVLTRFAKGDLFFAVGFMPVLAVMSVLIAPVYLSLLPILFPGLQHISIPLAGIIKTIVLPQILPLIIGLVLARFYPESVKKTMKLLGPLNLLLFLVAFSMILWVQWPLLKEFGGKTYSGMLLVFLIAAILAWAMGGKPVAMKKALLFSTTIRNAPAAMLVTLTNFSGTSAPAAVLIYAMFALAGSALLLVVINRFSPNKEILP